MQQLPALLASSLVSARVAVAGSIVAEPLSAEEQASWQMMARKDFRCLSEKASRSALARPRRTICSAYQAALPKGLHSSKEVCSVVIL